MAVELNTIAPKKWVANYSGSAPTIDTTDGVSVGDFAIDSSNDAIWRCTDNTDTAAVWVDARTNLNSVETGSLIGLTSKDISLTVGKKYRLSLRGLIKSTSGNCYPKISMLDGGAVGTGLMGGAYQIRGTYRGAITGTGGTYSFNTAVTICGAFIGVPNTVDVPTPVDGLNIDVFIEVFDASSFLISDGKIWGDENAVGVNYPNTSLGVSLGYGADDTTPFTSVDGIQINQLSSISAGTYELFEVTD